MDLIEAIQHDVRATEDYSLMHGAGLRTARDGVRWNLVDQGGRLDYSSFLPMLRASLETGVQVIWDLCHYGFPDDLDLLKPAFVDRFAKYARGVAQVFADHTDDVPAWSPMNEISFFTWAASREFMYPWKFGYDDAIKRQLVRAAIAGAEAVWDVDPRARLVYPEPVLHVVARPDRPDLLRIAHRETQSQYEAWDMLAGYQAPSLGGQPRYLDILGANFYYRNQWEQVNDRSYLPWEPHDRDPRWLPLSDLLERVYNRYRRPILIAETGHFGSARGVWMRQIAQEVYAARKRALPLEGVCLYPVIDRHDWDDAGDWHQAGLWDLEREPGGTLRRVVNSQFAEELQRARELLESVGCS